MSCKSLILRGRFPHSEHWDTDPASQTAEHTPNNAERLRRIILKVTPQMLPVVES